jgi:hypothetical protein
MLEYNDARRIEGHGQITKMLTGMLTVAAAVQASVI